MTHLSQPITRAFRVNVEFKSGEQVYAAETFLVLAVDPFDAERVGRDRAADSAYCNERVPGLGIQVHVVGGDAPDPDGDPPPLATGRLGAACRRCLSGDLIRDAAARWDETGQRWTLVDVHDFETCQACGAYGEGLALWLALPFQGHDALACSHFADPVAYRDAVAALPDPMGTAFRLHLIAGLHYSEIAARMSLKTCEVERLIATALATLARSVSRAAVEVADEL